MKAIVTSLGMIVFVAAVVVGGTGAFFSDTETSTANTFTAGAIDLKVDSVAHINGLVCFGGEWVPESEVEWNEVEQKNELVEGANVEAAIAEYNEENPSNVPQAGDECAGTWDLADLDDQEFAYTFFDYGDLKPGDSGENTISLHVFNNDAYMCATVENVEDLDNTQTEPEADAPDADGLASGELDSELEFVIWNDDGDNILEEGEDILAQTEDANGIEGVYDLFTSANGAIPAAETAYLGVYWCYGDITVGPGPALSCDGSDVGNVSQTDSLKADIEFYVEQARHNEEFTCRQPDPEPELGAITVDKIVSFSDDAIAGVDVTDFQLTIDGPGDPIIVTDEIETANLPAGTYTVSEVYSGDPTGIIFDAQFSGACTDNGTTGTIELAAGGDVTCTITNLVSLAPVQVAENE